MGNDFVPPVTTEQQGMQAVPVSRQHQFFIRHTDPDTGKLLEGQFTCKKLSIKDISRIGVRRVQLNGGYHYDEKKPGFGIDEETNWTNQMIAYLEIALIQKPLWFNIDEIDDVDLMIKVYSECAKFENTFRSPQRGAAVSAGGSQADSGRASESSGAAGRVAPVGRGQVPPSLDP